MHKAGVSLDTPPNSAHFDASKCLKLPKEEHANENIPVATSVSTMTTAKSMEYPFPLPPPWYHYSPFSMPPIPPPYPYSAIPPGLIHPLGVSNHTVPNSSSPAPSPGTPGKAIRFKISLDEFCSFYNIDVEDQQKLGSLGYRPGDNNILKLETEDWKEVQFTKLRWLSFLDAHRRFLRDVKSGQWDHSLDC